MKGKGRPAGDPELERRLDAAFGSLRPRLGFQDQLWAQLRGRRSPLERLREWAAGLVAPAPALAAAAVLIVVVGALVVVLGHPFGGGAGGGTAFSRQAGEAALDRPVGSFGKLPVATLTPAAATPARVSQPGAPAGNAAAQAAAIPYYGPAELTWGGVVPSLQAFLPVYRYTEPLGQDADAFAAAHEARRTGSQAPLGVYSARGLTLRIKGSDRQAGREPLFIFTVSPAPGPGPTASDQAQSAAQQFLATHSLTPTWTNRVTVAVGAGGAVVSFQRYLEVPGASPAPQIDAAGQRAGLAVTLGGGQVAEAAGPLPLPLQRASYPTRSVDGLLRAALSQPAAGGSTLSSVPHVKLTNVQLVYIAVPAGSYGIFEPAFLFTGSFQSDGQTYEKRVLVVAIDDSELAPAG